MRSLLWGGHAGGRAKEEKEERGCRRANAEGRLCEGGVRCV